MRSPFSLPVLWSSLFILRCAFGNENNVFVNTLDGTLKGFSSIVHQKHVVTFLGIPFATPPLKELRFKHPISVKPWSNILDTTKPSATCIQPLPESWQFSDPMTRVWLNTTMMSEDCLYLNVWTNAINGSRQPEKMMESTTEGLKLDGMEMERNRRSPPSSSSSSSSTSSSNSFHQQLPNGQPVMVWIHGGNFVSGSANLELFNGAILASEMGVVVVSIQYRLGPLGFLCLGSEGIPGNQGLMDQVMALNWIKRNIGAFGGNKEQITLFGQGSGAVSAALHLLSPVSNKLFQQAILQSGSPLARWAVESLAAATDKARIFAKLSGCKADESSTNYIPDTESCLQSVEATTLIVNQWQMHLLSTWPSTTRSQRIARMYNRRYSQKILTTAGAFFDITFKVVMTEPFLTFWPHKGIELQRDSLNHRVLLGVNKDESIYELIHGLRMYFLNNGDVPHLPEEFKYSKNILDPLDILAFYIMDESFLHPILLQATVFEYEIPSRAFYKKDWTSEEVLRSLAEVAGDYNVKCPVIKFADLYSQGLNTQVFMYSFEHHSSGWTWPAWTGTMQGYEAEYIFGAPLNVKFQEQFYKFNDDERQLSESIMQFWANFAATGSPSMHPSEFHTTNKKLHWNSYETRGLSNPNADSFGSPSSVMEGDMGSGVLYPTTVTQTDTSREYLVLKLPKPVMEKNLKRHRCMFWREKLPMLGRRLLPNSNCKSANSKEQLKRLSKNSMESKQSPSDGWRQSDQSKGTSFSNQISESSLTILSIGIAYLLVHI